MMDVKAPILIIEDSPAIVMLMNDFLKKLGYTQIYSASTGKSSLELFQKLIDEGVYPIVLLDYQLPDMDGNSIMSQIMAIKPSSKVILVTATEKSDSAVADLIRQGLYHYLAKPLRLEKLKEVLQILESESQEIQEPMSELPTKNNDSMDSEKISEMTDFVLNAHRQISLARIADHLGLDKELVSPILRELETKGKIIKILDKEDVSCNQCDSVKILQVFSCPSCKHSSFRSAKLIEHYDCGNVSEENTYNNSKCPSCGKEIKALGVDYRIMPNHYLCNNCRDTFPELTMFFMCLKCENKFKLSEAKWIQSAQYKTVNT